MIEAGCNCSISSETSYLAHAFGVHALRENLHRKNVVVAIDDQSGQEISFAENYAIGICVFNDRLAIGRRLRRCAAASSAGKSATGAFEIIRIAIWEELE